MHRPPHMTPELTVRQVATAWPACQPILEQYPGSRVDGRWTLQEIRFFARDHRLDQANLLDQLGELAGVPVAAGSARSERKAPLPLIFLATVICLTLGGGWGVMLLLRIAWGTNFGAASGASVHVHGVAQLWGWMALFIFAVATHLLRQNTRRPSPGWMEYVAAGLIVGGIIAFFAGLIEPVRQSLPEIDVLGSILLGAAAVLFGISVIWCLRGRSASQHAHGFIFLIGWLWAWAGADLWMRLHYLNAAVPPDWGRSLLIILPVLGFATNAIYGFGIRLIPGLLNISPLKQRWFGPALLLHNAGLCLILMPLYGLHIAGAALMVGGAVAYLIGMNFLRSKPSRPIYGVDTRGHIIIRTAFFWLVVGLLMILGGEIFPELPHAYSGAWRHALTVGFITTMILGVGQRIIPVFIKQPLASNRLMLVSAALIIIGNAGRVSLELATIGNWAWAFHWMGLTGLAELTALLLFGLNLALTVRNRRHVYGAEEPLTANTRVREAVNVRPELQCSFGSLGIDMFDHAPFIAPSMTFGALALAVGRQPEQLISDLHNYLNSAPLQPDRGQTGLAMSSI